MILAVLPIAALAGAFWSERRGVSDRYGAVAPWMGGRGPGAGYGLGSDLGGRGGSPFHPYAARTSRYGVAPVAIAMAMPLLPAAPIAIPLADLALLIGAIGASAWLINTAYEESAHFATLVYAQKDASPWSPESDTYQEEMASISKVLAAGGLKIDPECAWWVTPMGQAMKMAQTFHQRLLDVAHDAMLTPADIARLIDGAWTRALERFAAGARTMSREELLRALSRGGLKELPIGFSTEVTIEGMALAGLFALEIIRGWTGAIPIDQVLLKAHDDVSQALQRCGKMLKDTWPAKILGKLGKWAWVRDLSMKAFLKRLVGMATGGTKAYMAWWTMSTMYIYGSAALEEVLETLRDPDRWDFNTAWDFLKMIAQHVENVAAIARGRTATWNVVGGGDAYLERADVPSVDEKEGLVPATTYRVYARASAREPYAPLPERVLFSYGPRLYTLVRSDTGWSWVVSIRDTATGQVQSAPVALRLRTDLTEPTWVDTVAWSTPVPAPEARPPEEPSGEPPASSPQPPERGRAPVPSSPPPSNAAPALREQGIGQWSSMGADLWLTPVDDPDTIYRSGNVPAGDYWVWTHVEWQEEPIRLEDGDGAPILQGIVAGQAYILTCDENGCSTNAGLRRAS